MENHRYICSCSIIHENIVRDTKAKMKSREYYSQLALLFKLFGDATRLQILHALEQNELCVCDIAALLGMTKSAISHQLKALRLAKLIRCRREGQIVYYTLADKRIREIIDTGIGFLPQP